MQLGSGTPYPFKPADFDAYLSQALSSDLLEVAGVHWPTKYALRDETGLFVGSVGSRVVQSTGYAMAAQVDGHPLLSFYLAPSLQGRGLMKSAVTTYLRDVAPVYKWEKMIGFVRSQNVGSARLLLKLGFRHIDQESRTNEPARGGGIKVVDYYELRFDSVAAQDG